jgi:mycofactocin precursor
MSVLVVLPVETEVVSSDLSTSAVGASVAGTPVVGGAASLIEAELLVEEISIDGMCGVY